jgi:adenylylsulfate kinase-like enzyme
MVIWITGLSGAGKTTLCDALHKVLKPQMPQLVRIDGDEVRRLIGGGLGYTEADRVTQIKRVQALAKMLADQGLIVLVGALYSHPDLMAWNRANLPGYFEVYLNAPLDLVRGRDSKGLYAAAEKGKAANVVGVDIPWHAPTSPDMVLDATLPPDELARQIIRTAPLLADAVAGGPAPVSA